MQPVKQERAAFGSLGLFLGSLAGPLCLGFNWQGLITGAAAGGIIFALFIAWLMARVSDRVRTVFIVAVQGLTVGALAGSTQVDSAKLSILLAALSGTFLFCLVGMFISWLKEKEVYASYPGEPFWVPFLGFLGASLGMAASYAIVHVEKISMPLIKSWQGIPHGIVLMVLLSLLLSLPWGFIAVANRKRPVIGGVFILLASLFVLMSGIFVIPFLFMPGSSVLWAGLVIGLSMIALGICGIAIPDKHFSLGIAAIVLSILSFVATIGGLLIGGILGILGGCFLIAWDGSVGISDDLSDKNEDESEQQPDIGESDQDMQEVDQDMDIPAQFIT